MTPRRHNIRIASEEMLFGPDKLPYSEALKREWAKQPPIPGNNSVKSAIPARKRAGRLSPRRVGRYDSNPTHVPQRMGRTTNPPIKEGTMPRRAAATAVEPEETGGKYDHINPADYADKDITVTAVAYAEWLTDQVGYEVDPKTVHLTMSLRRKFQSDPDTRARIAELREEAAEAAKAAKAKETPAEETPKPARRTRSKASTVTSTSSTSKPAATAKAGGTTGRRGTSPARGRKPAVAAAAKSEAPF